jgi:hypothetical protein
VAKLQPLADQITRIVDDLIPGASQDYPGDGIVCFEAPARWKKPEYTAAGFAPPPVTIASERVYDEPPEAHGNEVRIVLNAGPDPSSNDFVFQLSHELAHVKMGHRTDNYLNETFAVALSFEVLLRFGYGAYVLQNEALYMSPSLLESLVHGRWNALRDYWLSAAKAEALKTPSEQLSDRSFQMVGSVLILHNQNLRWRELLDVSAANTCALNTPANRFDVCPPDFSRMHGQRSFLKPLGLKSQ